MLLKFPDGEINLLLIENRFPLVCPTYRNYIEYVTINNNTLKENKFSWEHKYYSVKYIEILLDNDLNCINRLFKIDDFLDYIDYIGVSRLAFNFNRES